MTITFGKKQLILTALFLIIGLGANIAAQSNTFTYQGSLQNSGLPANGTFDFEFVLYDAANAGNQIGLVTRNGVAVSNAVFAVSLDFAPGSFSGAGRYLEIRVRPTGQQGITILTPRHFVNSAPYAIRSLNTGLADTATNALGLGGIGANQFVVTTDPRMTDARPPTPGSGDYVQNRLTTQPAASFNISGSGTVGGTMTAGTVRANTQFNIGSSRILSLGDSGAIFLGANAGNLTMTGTANTLLGTNAGNNITTGFSNTFVGQAGASNTTGNENAFFGYAAGSANTTGSDNAYFGRSAGHFSETGSSNAFFGYAAGYLNAGNSNSFFGYRAGYNNAGGGNAFFGANAGFANTTGLTNSFFGVNAGESNTTGQNNAFFGANAGAAMVVGLGNSFFGANAGANTTTQFNSFFGASAGYANTTGFNNSFFGTVAGVDNTTGFANSFFGHWAGHENTSGDNNTFFGRSAGEHNLTGNGNTFIGQNSGLANTTGSSNTLLGAGTNLTASNLSFATAIGAGATVDDSNLIVIGRSNNDDRVFIPGILRLWSFAGAANNPLCANFGGQVGLCIGTANAKLQQSEIEAQKKEIEDLRSQLEALKKLVCATNVTAEVCKP